MFQGARLRGRPDLLSQPQLFNKPPGAGLVLARNTFFGGKWWGDGETSFAKPKLTSLFAVFALQEEAVEVHLLLPVGHHPLAVVVFVEGEPHLAP